MEWTWDVSRWELMQHLAVWPLATLVIGILAGFLYLSVSDPTLPDDGTKQPEATEAIGDDARKPSSRHRA